jgi:hypothetical protein
VDKVGHIWTVINMGKSAVELSPKRKKIEEMILEGETDRDISDWTKNQGCYICKSAINNYRKKFNPKKKAREKYHDKKSKERLDKAADEIVSDLEFLDKVKDVASKVNVQVDDDTKPIDIVKVGIQAVKTKNEILKSGEGDEKEFKIKIISVDPDEDNNMEAGKETSG